MQLVPLLPLLPLDRRLCIPLIHADDVAEAISRVIDERAAGPFNLAAEPPIGRDDVAAALGARPVHIPSGVLGALVDLSWRARLQHIDRGWLDLAFTVPLLDCSRARTELGWAPKWTSTEALADLLDGVANQDSRRQRTVAATLDARPPAPRRDRRVDLIASAALSGRGCANRSRREQAVRRPVFRHRHADRRNPNGPNSTAASFLRPFSWCRCAHGDC